MFKRKPKNNHRHLCQMARINMKFNMGHTFDYVDAQWKLRELGQHLPANEARHSVWLDRDIYA